MTLSIFSCSYCPLYIFFGEISVWALCHFFLLGSKSSLCILDISSLSEIWFANNFFRSVSCLLFLCVFWSKKFLILINWYPVYLVFLICAFGVIFICAFGVIKVKYHCLIWGHENLRLSFPLRRNLYYIIISYIYVIDPFELIFV